MAKGIVPNASAFKWNLGSLSYFFLFTTARLTTKKGPGGADTYGNLKDGADALMEMETIQAWLMDPIQCPTTWPALLASARAAATRLCCTPPLHPPLHPTRALWLIEGRLTHPSCAAQFAWPTPTLEAQAFCRRSPEGQLPQRAVAAPSLSCTLPCSSRPRRGPPIRGPGSLQRRAQQLGAAAAGAAE